MKYKILVIDDDKPFHIFMKSLLNKKFDSFHAHDAQEGINILSAENINLVLCDLHMPGLSGFEFLQALKKDGSKNNIPVLILTNLPTPEKKEQAQQFGAADIFDKTELNMACQAKTVKSAQAASPRNGVRPARER